MNDATPDATAITNAPDDAEALPRVTGRWRVAGIALAAGVCLAGSVPPWGWWPLAFVGIALLDLLLADAPARSRFKRGWLTTAAWLFPAMLWMWDLTPPGYVIAAAFYPCYFGLAFAAVPGSRPGRLLALPGAVALAELVRWYWPFGGVPLANLALSQVDSPLAISARLAGPLLVIVCVVALGQALASAVDRQWRAAAIGAAVVVAIVVAGELHPRAEVVRTAETAAVQGGGPTRTRASSDQNPVVLARHVEATRHLADFAADGQSTDLDLVVWPENVVNPSRTLTMEEAIATVTQVAADVDAVLMPGWFHRLEGTTNNVNYHTAVAPDGEVLGRYDKVRIVPFGEFVPLRGLIEIFNSEIPNNDVLAGTEPGVLDTPLGPIGVSISWEGFFERRARASVANGAQLLTNPTNGSSYWLTQVHTQQVASNQLRAIENDRWVVMVAPTGLSAIVDADGNVVQRTGIGERRVLIDTVEFREGRTLASRVGFWPVVALALAGYAAAWRHRRHLDSEA